MKKLALISFMAFSIAVTTQSTYAAGAAGEEQPEAVTDMHVQIKHFKGGRTEHKIIKARHTAVNNSHEETATLFFAELGNALDAAGKKIKEGASKLKDKAKDMINKGATWVANKTAKPQDVEQATQQTMPDTPSGESTAGTEGM